MELKAEDLATVKPDCLAPAAIAVKAETVGTGKANMSVGRAFPLSILAGIYIGTGGLFMLFVKADSTLSFAASQILGGLVFSLGLFMVIVAGAELFTGNCLMVCGALSKKYTWIKMLKSWLLVWCGNFIGSLILVAVVYFANCAGMNSGGVGNAMITTACSKISLAPGVLFCRAIMCNFLVCMAVWMGFAGKTAVDKVVTSCFPIMAFVAMGFEHCVANMFFLPMGYILKVSGFAYTGAANLDVLTLGGVFYNIGLATLGNIVGGAVFVGCMYWISFRKKEKAAAAAAK